MLGKAVNDMLADNDSYLSASQKDKMLRDLMKAQNELHNLLEEDRAFKLINTDKNLQSYNIDFHFGITRVHGEELFNRLYY